MSQLDAVPKKILVPTDFSHCSDQALRYAHRLATALGGELAMLHVTELTAGLEPQMTIRPDDLRSEVTVEQFAVETAKRRMLDQIGRILGSVAVQCETRLGKPAATIAEAAETLGADMIIMGTHGRTGLEHFLLGSVAERVVRTSSVPVLTVRFDGAADPTDASQPTLAEERIADEETG